MSIWTPANLGQLTSGDPLGPSSCVSYSFAYAVSHATGGRVSPTGRTIRSWTGDTLGGLELGQCDRAVTGHTDVEPMTGVWTEAQFYDYLAHGWIAVLLGGYAPIEASRFSGQPGFYRNHAIEVPGGLAVEDPLADGRRSGIYKFHGEAYPRSLVNAFAAALRDSTGHNVGPNHFEASLIRVEQVSASTVSPVLPYRATVDQTNALRVYHPDVATRTIPLGGAEWKRNPTQFTSGCTGRFRMRLADGTYRSLIRLLTGPYGDAHFGKGKGWWLNADAPNVHFRRVA